MHLVLGLGLVLFGGCGGVREQFFLAGGRGGTVATVHAALAQASENICKTLLEYLNF